MANERMGWSVVVVATVCALGGLAAGWRIAAVQPVAHTTSPDDHAEADDQSEALSAATLRTLGVEFGIAQPTAWTRTMPVAAVVEAPPEVERTVRAPFGGRVISVEARLGDHLEPGALVVSVLRDPLPRPTLALTGSILKPAPELHETVLELRARVQELELARTELERVMQYTAEVEGEELPLIPLQRRIDLEYRVARAEASVEQSRMEMEKHGLDHEQIESIEAGGHLPQASSATWRRALEHNGVWTPQAEALYEALPDELRETPWVIGTVGELAGVGLATDYLTSWLRNTPSAGERFLEIGVLLQRGHTLEDVQRMHALGALAPVMFVRAPQTANDGEGWDVRRIHVQPEARVEAGAPLVDLENPASMLLRFEPVGGEVEAVLEAKAGGTTMRAVSLIPGAGPELNDLEVSFVASSRENDATVAYAEAKNVLLAGNGGRRTWGLRPGTRYTVFVPRETLRDVFVLPAEAVAEVGPDLVVYHREGEGPLFAIPLAVVYRDEREVVVERIEGLDLLPGDQIALSGAFALSLALRGSDDAGGHGHAH